MKYIFKNGGVLFIVLSVITQTLFATTGIDKNLDVGTIDGAHAVNLSGAFNYTIPIKIPEGTMGMQPNLSLNYNSQSGNGIAGYGWNLSGVSAISRVNKNIHNDGVVGDPDLTYKDALALDGKRIFFSATALQPKEDNPLEKHNVRLYSTEIESFQRIFTNDDEKLTNFTIKTKDGKTVEYGHSFDSKLRTEDGTATLVWYINKITDRNGNYMTYHYKKIGRQVVLDEIRYTGNNDKKTPKSPHTIVSFVYKDRFDKSLAYIAGSKVESYNLLSDIKITANGQHYKSYQLLYEENHFSYLSEFQEWGIELIEKMTEDEKNKRLNSLTFEYGTSTNQINTLAETNKTVADLYAANNGDAVYIPGNFNGDGLTDYLVLTYEFKNEDKKEKARYKNAYVYINNNFENPKTTGFVMHNISNQVVTNNQKSLKIKELFQRDDSNEWLDFIPKAVLPINNVRVLAGDMNGDGIDDIVVGREIDDNNILTNERRYLYYDALLSKGNGSTEFKLGNKTIKVDHKQGVFFAFDKVKQHVAALLDANGDGKLEFFALNNDGGRYSLNSFDFRVNMNGCIRDNNDECIGFNIAQNSGRLKVHDYDGDGKNEVTYLYAGLDNFAYDFTFDLSMDKPLQFIPSPNLWSKEWFYLDGKNVYNTSKLDNFIDLNGDGKTDKIELGKDGVFAALSTSKTGYKEIEVDIPYVFNDPTNDEDDIVYSSSDNFYYYFIDINSDGFTDCVTMNPRKKSIDISLNKGLGIEFTQHSFPISNWNWHSICQFVDINGDGILEIQVKSTSKASNFSTKFVSVDLKPTQARLLKNVYDSYANNISVEYLPLSSEQNYSFSSDQSYPYRKVSIPIQVVHKVNAPTNNTKKAVTEYAYEDLTLHLEGKGMLGFGKITETDKLNMIKTESTYTLNKSKKLMLPDNTISYLFDDEEDILVTENDKISESSFSYYYKESSALNFYEMYQNKTTSIDHTNKTKTITEYQNYDNDGNPRKSITTIYDIQGTAQTIKHTTTEDITYKNCDWWTTYLPETIKTTLKRAEHTTSNARSVKYEYYVSNGNLKTETTDPLTSNEIITTYSEFNIFGNPTKTVKKAKGETEERTTTVAFDNTGRFVTERKVNEINGAQTIEHIVETIVPNYKWGAPASITDIDGNITSFTYDNYGRLHTTTDFLSNTTTTTYSWETAAATGYNIASTYAVKNEVPNAPETVTYFDQFGREVLSSTQQFGSTALLYAFKKYDTRGRVTDESGSFEIEKAGQNKEKPTLNKYTYDKLNRVLTSEMRQYQLTNGWTKALTEKINYSYPVRMVEVKGTKTPSQSDIISKTSTYDVTGKLITVQDPGGYLHYSYNNFNELSKVKSMKDGVEHTLTTSVYDKFGRQTELIDVNAGTTTYKYNPFDELTSQTDAKSNTTTITYDNMGRIETKSLKDAYGAVIDYTYVYYSANNNGQLQLNSESISGGGTTTYTYDAKGRLKDKTDNISNQKFTTSQTYNTFGDIETITYPGNFTVTYQYDATTGAMYKAKNGTTVLYEMTGTNHLGQISDYQYSNGTIPVSHSYNALGMPATTTAKNNSNATLFNWLYDFNKTNGNLKKRKDVKNNKEERFLYDALHRLTHVNEKELLKYTANGNIEEKEDAGTYTYNHPDGEKINAVTGISNEDETIALLTENITYTAFDRPQTITEESTGGYILQYGAQHQRQKTILNSKGQETTRYYSGSFELLDVDGQQTSIYYLSFANAVDAIYVKKGNTGQFYYTFTDYLGSILKVVNAWGVAKEEQSFDAWGRKRNPQNWADVYDAAEGKTKTLTWLNRGYTGHEHLYEFGLINMNNRLYDPIVGRMLAVDNEVPDAESTQGYNRYAYAMNNPLKYTDPSGDVIISVLTNGFRNLFNGDPFFFNWGNAAVMGAIQSAFSFGIGELGIPFGLNLLAHGHLGGLFTAIGGGKYHHGFLSTIAGATVGYGAGNINNGTLRFGVSVAGAGLVGGGTSHLAGGNFWDGFRNGAIAATLNHLLHPPGKWPPKDGDPEKIKLAELLAEQNGGDPYTYYEVLTNPDALNNSLIDGAFNLFGLATLAPVSKVLGFFGRLFSKGGVKYSDDLVKQAQKLYPKKAGKIEQHHIIPKYLGGAKDGVLVPLDGAYHQLITNAFRKEWGYGLAKPTAKQLQIILDRVYSQYPLPKGYLF